MSEKIHSIAELSPPYRLPYALAGLLEIASRTSLEMEYLAYHDELTGALNRRGFKDYLETAKTPKALLVVDDTNLKGVNDILGPDYGDRVIVDTHVLLKKAVRRGDVIARWGGDEWLVALNGDGSQETTVYPEEENRRENLVHVDHVEDAKLRISHLVAGYLVGKPELQHPDINFDLAVGGLKWTGGLDDIEDLVVQATVLMKAHKEEQHRNGQHRP